MVQNTPPVILAHPPLRATFNILQALLGSTGSGASTALRDAEVVARALLQDLHLGGASGHERKIFTKFVDAFTDARAATADFGALRLDNMDISQNLYAQLETCLQLFSEQSGTGGHRLYGVQPVNSAYSTRMGDYITTWRSTMPMVI